MSTGISSRLKAKKHELVKSHSQAHLLANKLRQEGAMETVENVVQVVDQVTNLLASNIIDPNIPYKDSIMNLSQHLKVYGAYLEILYKEQLDHAFKVFRDKAQDHERTDAITRLQLLELIELRANGWKGTDVMNQYYRKKINQYSQIDMSESMTSLAESLNSMVMSVSPPLLGPGEIIKPSGKFTKPTRIPGKKYCKDEVVIRNADSGKVMGIKGRRVHMIEELSETIISFQRVNPGAKERLVQITGANEESITHAKQLIEDTIKRNASPVRDHVGIGAVGGGPLTGSSSSINSSASDDSALPPSARASSSRALLMHSLSTNDAHIGEYKYSVVVGGNTIRITGDNLDIVRTSKLVLEEYFSGTPLQEQFYSFDSLPQPLPATPTTTTITSNATMTGAGAELSESTNRPLSPPESLPSPGVGGGQVTMTNGQIGGLAVSADEPDGKVAKLRKPNATLEDILKGSKSAGPPPSSPTGTQQQSPPPLSAQPTTTEGGATGNRVYSIEVLAKIAMSPLCLGTPPDWERIAKEYPCLVRNTVEYFDAKQYLLTRTSEPASGVLSLDEVDPADL